MSLQNGGFGSPNPSQIDPKALPNAEKGSKLRKMRSVSAQDAPKSEKCANMAATWKIWTCLVDHPDPLRKEKQYVNASIKCSRV